jgi:hypothetical protein
VLRTHPATRVLALGVRVEIHIRDGSIGTVKQTTGETVAFGIAGIAVLGLPMLWLVICLGIMRHFETNRGVNHTMANGCGSCLLVVLPIALYFAAGIIWLNVR